MTLLPTIIRELRANARYGFTYWLRVIGAGVLLIGTFFAVRDSTLGSSEGRHLFKALAGTLFIGIWCVVPLMSADCISRERREGTLGLLFLTPLRAVDIVLAKGLVHGLRAHTLVLAALPVMTLPFLIGGVSWAETVTAFCVLLASLMLALGAGVLASSWTTLWTRALVLATVLGAVALATFLFISGIAVFEAYFGLGLRGGAAPRWFGFAELNFWEVWSRKAALGWLLFLNPDSIWRGGGAGTPAANLRIAGAMGAMTLPALLASIGMLILAARNVRRHWRDEPPSARQRWLEKHFCTPVVAVGCLQRWMRRQLECNPVGWLEQRRWSGRVLAWIWFAVACSMIFTLLVEPRFFSGGYTGELVFLIWIMCACLAVTSAGSFQRERETGLLELLLVTPLTTKRILLGRLFGLWRQFLLTACLIMFIWLFFLGDADAEELLPVLVFVSSYLTIPIVGLYFSLRCTNYIVALGATVAVALVVPFGLSGLIDDLVSRGIRNGWLATLSDNVFLGIQLLVIPLQVLVARVAGRELYRDLNQRRFALRSMT